MDAAHPFTEKESFKGVTVGKAVEVFRCSFRFSDIVFLSVCVCIFIFVFRCSFRFSDVVFVLCVCVCVNHSKESLLRWVNSVSERVNSGDGSGLRIVSNS